MAMIPTPPQLRVLLTAAACAIALPVLVAGCASPAPSSAPSSGGAEQTQTVAPATPPDAADLTSPETAVRSYLDWVSYAYRTAVSDVASHTMSPEEAVRVDSYLQYNLAERNRRIDQQLVRLRVREQAEKDARAELSATEQWEYRYLTSDGGRSTSPTHAVSYETTYTLVRTAQGWVVDSVEATPLDDVQ